MKKKVSPTQRSLRFLRDKGYHAQVVERRIPFKFITVDLFKWIDIVAVHEKEAGVVGVQTTSGTNHWGRLAKAKGNAALLSWILAGGRLILHSWRKRGGRWIVNERTLAFEDVAP